ncbi:MULTISPECIES: hypothetical protein [Virgibacillus]|uniref:Uncharacterized protein n=1 Tax=Virgibacillus massiliensis TaxID=1462526 RepID=A0A024QI60_9BACI|nr:MULTISPECIES: hypothetical protein [Virgibacillus]EQB34660.1 hypothetical protein M948_19940 [Virgibacillus sp. CM-4]CDQ41636.1 hypothetical protein BN990_04010 [Virgibacillus massiliensis]
MFGLPVETALLMLPWPLIWIALGIFMFIKFGREEKHEAQRNVEKGDDAK